MIYYAPGQGRGQVSEALKCAGHVSVKCLHLTLFSNSTEKNVE